MARETREDRIVRGIFDQVTEHLHEFKALEANATTKESDIERWAQSFLKNCLGFTPSTGYTIRSQESKGKMRPDLIVFKADKPIFVVEVKRLGFDLNKSDFRSGKIQLSEYLQTLGSVRWGMLTNGTEWKLFDFSQPQYGGIEIGSFDLKSESDVIELGKKAVEEQCYEFVDLHESTYSSDEWVSYSKEALAFSPDSLAKAILSSDVVKYIARYVKGEHEFKANQEVLTDRVAWLLIHGLNDLKSGWNEQKEAELSKYIKTQKRVSRKTKRAKKIEVAAPALETPITDAKVDTITDSSNPKSGAA
jgi:hypothetical protein